MRRAQQRVDASRALPSASRVGDVCASNSMLQQRVATRRHLEVATVHRAQMRSRSRRCVGQHLRITDRSAAVGDLKPVLAAREISIGGKL